MPAVAEVIVLVVDTTAKADIRGIHARRGTREIKARPDPDRTHIFVEVPEVFAEPRTFTFQTLTVPKQYIQVGTISL